MKKLFLVMVMTALAGCSHGFLRAGHSEQEQNQAQIAIKEEFRSEKMYRILEEKGTYYVVRLKITEVVSEKESPNEKPPMASVTTFGSRGETEAQPQVQIANPEKKTGLKSEMPKGNLLGGASNKQAKATNDLMVDSHNVQLAKTKEHSKEVKASGGNIKKESHITGENVKKEINATKKFQLGQVENRLKSLEDFSFRKGRREITIYFPQDKTFLIKGTPEHNRLNSFADSISGEAGSHKVFFALIGSASAKGDSQYNLKLSQRRAEFVRKVLDGLLVNVPYEYHRVYGQGDSQSPKAEDKETNEKYQSVRIVAVHDIKEFPDLTGIKN